jgi:hypothetical protein
MVQVLLIRFNKPIAEYLGLIRMVCGREKVGFVGKQIALFTSERIHDPDIGISEIANSIIRTNVVFRRRVPNLQQRVIGGLSTRQPLKMHS